MKGGEGWPGRDPLVIADELEGFTTAQLLAEVGRRERALREQVEGVVLCDGCIHRRFWKRRGDPPDTFNVCSLGHGLDFKMPEDMPETSDDWGFYRPGGCTDRAEPPPPPPPPVIEGPPERPRAPPGSRPRPA